jgi:hypothetical protein
VHVLYAYKVLIAFVASYKSQCDFVSGVSFLVGFAAYAHWFIQMASYTDLIPKIINPESSNAEEILAELGLNGLPTPQEIHREIEQKLLLPPDKFPDHWLPYLQK